MAHSLSRRLAAEALCTAILVATDPVTRQLGRIEEKVSEVVTEESTTGQK